VWGKRIGLGNGSRADNSEKKTSAVHINPLIRGKTLSSSFFGPSEE